MSNDPITAHYRCSAPVRLSVQLESYYRGPDIVGPDSPVPVLVLSFRLNGREICQREFSPDQGQRLLDGSIFDDLVRLGILCRTTPGFERGLMCVALAAIATTEIQAAHILDADSSLDEGLPLWNFPEGLVGFDIGRRWFPASPEVLEPIPVGPESGPRLAEFDRNCKKFADRILWGSPGPQIAQLLAEVGMARENG